MTMAHRDAGHNKDRMFAAARLARPSFEPFANCVHPYADIKGDLRASIAHIEAGVARV